MKHEAKEALDRSRGQALTAAKGCFSARQPHRRRGDCAVVPRDRMVILDLRTTDEKSYERQDEYFAPRMKATDQQLQTLSNRLGAEYTPGIVDWRAFATADTLATSVDITPSPWWGFGSVVRKLTDANTIEITYGVEPLIPEQRFRAFWYLFVPRVTVTVPSSARPLLRFYVFWTTDTERQGTGGRILDNVFSHLRPPLPAMPPAVERAHSVLRMNASSIWCGKESVEVTGRPLPRAPDDTVEFGQGDFAVESTVRMIEQTLAFVRTLEEA